MGRTVTPASGAASDTAMRGVRWRTIIAIWSLPAFVASYSSYVAAGAQGHPIAFWRALAMQCPGWFVWVPLTPVVFALARRFPIERRPDLRTVGVHVAFLILALVLYTTIYVWANIEFRPSPLALTPA
ncbi:MAG TPA: hypothetical protein VIG47_13360, partial [Gemmatimonadaceae bacterium]